MFLQLSMTFPLRILFPDFLILFLVVKLLHTFPLSIRLFSFLVSLPRCNDNSEHSPRLVVRASPLVVYAVLVHLWVVYQSWESFGERGSGRGSYAVDRVDSFAANGLRWVYDAREFLSRTPQYIRVVRKFCNCHYNSYNSRATLLAFEHAGAWFRVFQI